MATAVRGLNIQLGLDSSQFDNSIKGLNKEIKNTNSNLNILRKASRIDSKNVSLYKQRQKELNDVLKLTKMRLDAQNKELEEAKVAFKAGEIGKKELDKVQRAAANSEIQIAKMNKELAGTKTAMTKIKTDKLDKLSSGFKKVGGTLTKSLTAPILGLTAALGKLTFDFAKAGDEIAKSAKTAGVTAESYQELSFVADRLGVDSSTLSKGLERLNREAGNISRGISSTATRAFEELGISILDANGKIKPTEALFLEVRNALSQVENEAIRASLANDIFGKSGVTLRNVLAEEDQEIERLINTKRELGVITNEEAAQAEITADKITNLKNAFNRVAADLATRLLPAFEALIEFLQDKIIPTIQNIVEWWDNLSEGQKETILVIVAVIAALGPLLSIIGTMIGLFSALTAVSAALNISMLPLILIVLAVVAAIAALIAIGILVIKNWDKIKSKASEIANKLRDAFITVVDKIKDAFKTLATIVFEVFKAINRTIIGIFNKILGFIAGIINKAIRLVNGLIDAFNKINPFGKISKFNEVNFQIGNPGGSSTSTTTNNNNVQIAVNGAGSPQATGEAINRELGLRLGR